MTATLQPAVASAGLADHAEAFRLDIHSIGSASPGNAAAIAVGLGAPVTLVMEALYRAPSPLVDGLTETAGTQMRDLLQELGCDVALSPQRTPPPPRSALFDVALHVTEASRFGEITAALAAFLGTSSDEAARLIATPPGIVLGKVSRATIEALDERLGHGAALTASDPEAARYDVFLGACDATVRARLLADLRRRGMTPLAEDGCLMTGLTRAEADGLWSAHHRVKELRVVNRDFLRFDLVLTGGAPSPAATRALVEVAGIPERVVARLFDAGEITVMEAVANTEMLPALERLTTSGLELRADLISFQHLGLEITEAPRPRVISDALGTLGVEASERDLCRLPYRLPVSLPELQARLVREALAGAGARAELIDLVPAEAAA